MSILTLKCACGRSTDVEHSSVGCYNVGEIIEKSGWKWVPLEDGKVCWLCPTCGHAAAELAIALIEIVGNNRFVIRSLNRD